jgi:hypothetical protein
MGRKSSSKQQSSRDSSSSSTPPSKGGVSPVLLGVLVVGVLAIGGFMLMGGGDGNSAQSTSAAADAQNSKGDEPTPAIIAATEAQAKLGPHKQENLPPIPFAAYAPPRPPEVVTAAFHFAAEHPEVASYVPCFCGCQHSGHKGNTDCFVKSRAANGDVVEWEEHGVECAVCIDVATRSLQMLASGASVRDIRTAVEKEFGPKFPTMTPTPKPPALVSQAEVQDEAESHNH